MPGFIQEPLYKKIIHNADDAGKDKETIHQDYGLPQGSDLCYSTGQRNQIHAESIGMVKKAGISNEYFGGDAMRYKVNLKKTEEGYSIWVPGFPGCWSQGKTEAEALENIKDAIRVYVETADELISDKESRYVEVANA